MVSANGYPLPVIRSLADFCQLRFRLLLLFVESLPSFANDCLLGLRQQEDLTDRQVHSLRDVPQHQLIIAGDDLELFALAGSAALKQIDDQHDNCDY